MSTIFKMQRVYIGGLVEVYQCCMCGDIFIAKKVYQCCMCGDIFIAKKVYQCCMCGDIFISNIKTKGLGELEAYITCNLGEEEKQSKAWQGKR